MTLRGIPPRFAGWRAMVRNDPDGEFVGQVDGRKKTEGHAVASMPFAKLN